MMEVENRVKRRDWNILHVAEALGSVVTATNESL
jgi:hypothetical protein